MAPKKEKSVIKCAYCVFSADSVQLRTESISNRLLEEAQTETSHCGHKMRIWARKLVSPRSCIPTGAVRLRRRPKMSPEIVDIGTIFVTVGTTRFDTLLSTVLDATTLNALRDIGASRLVLQHGHGPSPTTTEQERCESRGLALEAFDFMPDIAERIAEAGLVISHGGAGSLMESLRFERKVVAVVNRQLMHDHQSELAAALHAGRHLIATDVSGLCTAVKSAVNANFLPLPQRDTGILPTVLGQESAWWS